MANYKDLCRLCAKNDEFSKDLFDENNKNILKMIQDFTQIPINESDDLPKKICLNCEEKMVTFQLFVLECYKAQEFLKIFKDKKDDIEVKYENCSDEDSIKAEVKAEVIPEDIIEVLKEQETLSETLSSSYLLYDDVDNHHDEDDYKDDTDDKEDNLTIAKLKKIKQKQIKDKIESVIDIEALNNILQKSSFKVKDIIKFDCLLCDEKMKSWSNVYFHYIREHKSKPVIVCLCGYEIRSQSQIYKHVSDHKIESKKLKEENEQYNDEQRQQELNINVKDYIRFICSECSIECSSWYTLKSHCEKDHKISPVVQCSCGVTLKSKTVMYKHVQDHKNPNMLACDKCPRITKSLSALNKHKMRHVPKSERKFCCSGCDKIFNTKDAMKSHERSHIPVEDRKIYSCDVCSLKFTTRSSALSHKRVVHDKIKSYVCDLCGYACGTNGELRQHRAIHSADKPFVCNKCSKPFKTYSNLKTHMDTHEDTAYECYVCRRVLNSRRTLRKHLLVHEDKCRHVCSYCNKAFKRRQTLKVHMYTHTGDKPLSCKWCDERFAYASTLRSHRLRCHSDKMAAHAHDYTQSYTQHGALQSNYIKNDLLTVSIPVSKNEVDDM